MNITTSQDTLGRRKVSLDRRIQKTTRFLRATLLELMQSKRVEDISVRELTDKAGISKGTFYMHYKDVTALLDSTQDEALSHFTEAMSAFSYEGAEGRPLPFLINLFRYFHENKGLSAWLLTGFSQYAFANKLEQLLTEELRPLMPQIQQFGNESGANIAYRLCFAVSGCMGLLRVWMENGMRETPMHMAFLTENVILNGYASKKGVAYSG